MFEAVDYRQRSLRAAGSRRNFNDVVWRRFLYPGG